MNNPNEWNDKRKNSHTHNSYVKFFHTIRSLIKQQSIYLIPQNDRKCLH